MSKMLHFSLGENIADTMRQIAREHLFYKFDIEKAIAMYREGIGASEAQAKEFILGTKKLKLAEDGVHLEYCDATDEDVFDIDEWAEGKLKEIDEAEIYIKKGLEKAHKDVYTRRFQTVTIKLPIKFIRSLDKSDLEEEIDNAIGEQYDVLDYHDLFVYTERFLERFAKFGRVVQFLGLSFDYGTIRGMMIIKALYDSIIMDAPLDLDDDDNLSRYLDSARDLKDVSVIRPSDISVKYDACWIAPDGSYYGLNGTVANMLHIEMADMLEKVIPHGDPDEYDNNFYHYLEQNGWAKIHGAWVLFDNKDGKLSLTEEQKNTIYQFGQLHCEGVMQFGYPHTIVTASRFRMMDDLQIRKLFDF